MEFGKVSNVEGIDFSLPPDDRITDELFRNLAVRPEEPIKLQVGCTQWGNKEWIGKIYPKGTKDKDFLAHYVQQFNCIELNALFYNLQPKPVIEKWASLTGEDFRFCPKFLNTISHTRQLQNAGQDTDLFIDHMHHFGSRLGYSFLQLSDGFSPDRASVLQNYVRQLPRDFRTCVELRQQSWFAGPSIADTWQLFRDLGIGTVITDSSGRRDCVHMKLTAPVAFIRFVANNMHPTDFTRIDAWADRLRSWISKGLREIYFIVHSHHELHAPELVYYAITKFNEKCGTDLRPPKLLKDDTATTLTLF